MKVDDRLIQQLAERLKQAVRDTRHIETAQIQIVGLEDVKRRAGPRWPELAARVRNVSHDFIGQRTGPHDLVFPAGDGFLVVYAEPDGAQQKCRALQDDINAFYLGEEFTRGLSASVRHESVGAATLMEQFRHQATPQAEARPGLALAPASAPADLPLTMLPVWSVQQEAITGYWITPEHPGRSFARYGYDPVWAETGWRRDDKDFLELDLRILARTVSEIQGCLARGQRCLMGYSVHAATMTNRNRRAAFLQALAATPAAVRPFLLGRVSEVESGTPLAVIVEWTHQLRVVSPRLAIAIHPTQRDVTGLEELGVFSVACVLPTANPTAADVATLTRTITAWSRDLKRQNLKLRIDNLENPQLLGLALDGHVDFCTSPRLWPPVPGPEGMKPYSRDRFLKSLPLAVTERRSA
ncbi:MAG: hypothetical protein ACXU82_04015 [Caulobacteraceae bacterium]